MQIKNNRKDVFNAVFSGMFMPKTSHHYDARLRQIRPRKIFARCLTENNPAW